MTLQEKPNSTFSKNVGPSKSSTSNSSIVITPKELKELKRVYKKLCNNSEKTALAEQIQKIRKEITALCETEDEFTSEPKSSPSLNRRILQSKAPTLNDAASTNACGKGEKVRELEDKIMKLKKSLDQIESRKMEKMYIRPQDAATALKRLGRKFNKREVLDMIWEVDENLDNVVDWDEFRLMFERNIRDTSGLEPATFYHMVQFMIYDKDDNGMVSIDEAMNMLYARLGREKMESVIGKLFGGEDGAPVREVGVQGGEINFTRYYEVVTREQDRTFNDSEMGRTLTEKKNHGRGIK